MNEAVRISGKQRDALSAFRRKMVPSVSSVCPPILDSCTDYGSSRFFPRGPRLLPVPGALARLVCTVNQSWRDNFYV